MVTILSERGAPTPVVWTRMCPPRSLMAAIEPEAVAKSAQEDPLWGDVLHARSTGSRPGRSWPPAWRRHGAARRRGRAEADAAPAPAPAAPTGGGPRRRDTNPVVDYLKSREGRSMMNTVARGVFGLLRKRR